MELSRAARSPDRHFRRMERWPRHHRDWYRRRISACGKSAISRLRSCIECRARTTTVATLAAVQNGTYPCARDSQAPSASGSTRHAANRYESVVLTRPRMTEAASETVATTASGSYSETSHVRPRAIQIVRSPACLPPPMSSLAESPTIQPSSGTSQMRDASSKISMLGFRAPTTAEMQMASNSLTSLVASNFAHWEGGPLVTTPTFQSLARRFRIASTVSSSTVQQLIESRCDSKCLLDLTEEEVSRLEAIFVGRLDD